MRNIIFGVAVLGLLVLSVGAGLWLASGTSPGEVAGASATLKMKPGKWQVTMQATTTLGDKQLVAPAHSSEECVPAEKAAAMIDLSQEPLPNGWKFVGITTNGKENFWRASFPGGSFTTTVTTTGATFKRVMHMEKQEDDQVGSGDVVYTGTWLGDCPQ